MPKLSSCRWGLCRQTFTTVHDLREHIYEHHILTAVPIRKCDLPLYRRANEGFGETLSLPVPDNSGSNTVLSPQQNSSQGTSQSKNLPPSPPVSSPGQSPYTHPQSLQEEISGTPSLPPSLPQSPISFGRLSNEHLSPAPLANPGSPSFHSLVDRSKHSETTTSSESSPSKSSDYSQMSVEEQLNQSLDRDHSSDESNSPSLPSSQSQEQVLEHEKLETLPYPSQPPSQFQVSLLHMHGHPSTQEASALLRTPTGSLVPPAFAVSTPTAQTWYQSSPSMLKSLHRRASQSSQPSTPSQPRATRSGRLQHASKSTASRSGTPKPLKTLEHHLVKMSPTMEVDGDEHSQIQTQSQVYDDSFDGSQVNSYPPLQTQAPYSSQF